jgi:NitT/TauT family transport system permease protein
MKASTANNDTAFQKFLKTDKSSLLTILSFFLIIAIWKLVSLAVGAEIILPSPEKTFMAFIGLIKTKFFYIIILSSLYRGAIGFLISFILGVITGFFAGKNKRFYKLFEPFLIIIRSTPVITIILIALIWFKADFVPVFAGFLMIFPIICTNIIEGIKNVDTRLLQMAKIYKIRSDRIYKEIYAPSLVPFILSGVSSGFGIGWKVVIAAEVLSQPKYAIGSSLQNSRIYLNINEVFAWTLTAIVLGYAFEKIMRIIENKAVRWKKTAL